jgi:ATP-dependent NAD(P)H-hydrate dehydratase
MSSKIEFIMPELDGSLRKGDAGRVLLVGGSLEYTGAPYFAAMAAMKIVHNSACNIV